MIAATPGLQIPAVEVFDSLDSTSAEASRRAAAGQRGPVWIMARQQSAGVGRMGRVWSSPAGNLYATLLMPFAGPLPDAALMSFAACLAVADTLDTFVAPERVALKWPNDALLDNRKVAGVLLEAGGTETDRWLSIGIGINLAHTPEDFRWPPIALSEASGQTHAPEDVLDGLSTAFEYRRAAFIDAGFDFAPTRAAWMARAARLGERIEARLTIGNLSGIFRGIAENGALLLETAEGVAHIAAADIHFPA